MAGLGIGPAEFALFDIGDPDERADAIDGDLAPRLRRVAEVLSDGLSRVVGHGLLVHPQKSQRRRGIPPCEAVVALCAGEKGPLRLPFLAIGASREHLHARVGVRPAADRDGVIRRALGREAANLAKKGKPFRKLRPFMHWDGEELPEIAPAHSAAFWTELADELQGARPGIDVGLAWTAEEARSLAVGDVLGAFRDLAPLYKLLSNASERAAALAPAPAPAPAPRG